MSTAIQLGLLPGEIPNGGAADYWPTPAYLADRIINWAQPIEGERILEPSAGDGALVRAIRARDARSGCAAVNPFVTRTHVTAVESNPDHRPALVLAGADDIAIADWSTYAAEIVMRDRPSFDLAISNPPFSLIAQHVYPMCCVARRAVVLLPLTALEGQERHRELWSRVVLVRLAILVSRPRFGGHTSPATAYCVAEIVRRETVREPLTRVEWWT